MLCPHCKKEISEKQILIFVAGRAGRFKSKRKADAARENGKKGGRPSKPKEDRPNAECFKEEK